MNEEAKWTRGEEGEYGTEREPEGGRCARGSVGDKSRRTYPLAIEMRALPADEACRLLDASRGE